MTFLTSKKNYKLPLGIYLKRSSFLHIAIVLVILLTGYISQITSKNIKKHNVKLLERSIRVDMVAMPLSTMQELKKVNLEKVNEAPKLIPKVAQKKKDIINKGDTVLKKVVKKKSFMDMLKDIKKKNDSPRKKLKAKRGKVDGRSKKESEEYNKLVLMGNQLSKGNSTQGETNADQLTVLNIYAEKLLVKLKPLWTLPAYLKDMNLQCRIQVYLASSGRLIRAEVFESSGNDDYDKKALDIVKRASPYPRLPKEITRNAVNGDIILGFPI